MTASLYVRVYSLTRRNGLVLTDFSTDAVLVLPVSIANSKGVIDKVYEMTNNV